MIVYRDGLQVELKLHVVPAKLEARYVTRWLVALTSQVYVHIPGEGCSKMSDYFEEQKRRRTLARMKTKLEGLELKRLQS